MYDWLKFIHVVAVTIWVGGGILIAVQSPRLLATRERPVQAAAVRLSLFAGRVFTVAAIVALATGIWMVLDAEFIEFSQAWISLGFLGIAVGAVLGSAVYGPTGRRMLAAIDAGDDGTLTALSQRMGMATAGEILVLLVVIWSMVFKPGL